MSDVSYISIFRSSSLVSLKWLYIKWADFRYLNVQAPWDFMLVHKSWSMSDIKSLFPSETRLLQSDVSESII